MSPILVLLLNVSVFALKHTNNRPVSMEYYASCTINEAENKALCKGIEAEELNVSAYVGFDQKTSGLATAVIKKLEIRQGNTPTIPDNAIQFPTLTHLTIQNSVRIIESKAFNHLTNMKFIDLSNNNLEELPSELFKYTGVKHLKLSNNPNLTNPSDRSFIVAPRLLWLSLSGCSISNLSEDTFSEMPFLHHLDLSHNQIDALPSKIFEKTSLTFLDLSHNNFKTMDLSLFQKVSGYPVQPRNVILRNNPWHCDCSLAPVVSWLSQDVETHYPTSNPRRSRLLEHTKCETPSPFAHVSWNHLEMLSCIEENNEKKV